MYIEDVTITTRILLIQPKIYYKLVNKKLNNIIEALIIRRNSMQRYNHGIG